MITRYDQLIDVNMSDDVAIMYRQSHGEYVKYDDAMFIIEQLKTGLKYLKSCNSSINTPEQLNTYVSNLLESVE